MQALLLEILLIFPQILTSGNMGGLIPFVFTEFVSNMTFYAIAAIVGEEEATRRKSYGIGEGRRRGGRVEEEEDKDEDEEGEQEFVQHASRLIPNAVIGYSCISNLRGELPCKIPVRSQCPIYAPFRPPFRFLLPCSSASLYWSDSFLQVISTAVFQQIGGGAGFDD